MPDEQPSRIELRRCLYLPCAAPVAVAPKPPRSSRSVDCGGRPMKQYELCYIHANQVAERERAERRKVTHI